MLQLNLIKGTIIPKTSIESETQATDLFSFLLDDTRFDWFEYYNGTVRWTAKLILFEGYFEGNWEQPTGYVTGTGATVGGTDVFPYQNTHVIL
jgi:hypothetical protein